MARLSSSARPAASSSSVAPEPAVWAYQLATNRRICPVGRGERRFGKPLQTPALVLVGVGAAGHQYPALAEALDKIFDRLLDLFPPLLGFWHFVQSIQQQQPTAPAQFVPQPIRAFSLRSCFQFLGDEVPKVSAVASPCADNPVAAKSRSTTGTGSGVPCRQGCGFSPSSPSSFGKGCGQVAQVGSLVFQRFARQAQGRRS